LAVAESTIIKVEQKIERIESYTSWTVRLIIGAIIMAVIRIILKGEKTWDFYRFFIFMFRLFTFGVIDNENN